MDIVKSVPYRHVVLLKFQASATPDVVKSIEAAFRDLCSTLGFVRDFEWGINSSPEPLNNGFTHCFIVTFDDPAGRDDYLPHPLHQEFCKTYLEPNVEHVCVMDFHTQK